MEDGSPFYGFKNIFVTLFATFLFFKLLIKVFLALLTHFYVVKGNRKEAARIAEEIYGGISGKKTAFLKKLMHENRVLSRSTHCLKTSQITSIYNISRRQT